MLKFSSFILAVCLSACVGTPENIALEKPAPVFSPSQFFSGSTVGEGSLNIIMSGHQSTLVAGEGHVTDDGTLMLVQRIEREKHAPRTRTWNIIPSGKNSYTGTLSDAKGPISAKVSGNELNIRYKTKDGLDVEQWLFLQPGGETAVNHMVVRKLGVTVASLEETIRKID